MGGPSSGRHKATTEGSTMSGTEIATRNPLQTIVALTPAQMAESQGLLQQWCDDKLKEIEEDRLEFGVQEDAAKAYGFDVSAIRRRLSKLRAKREFYEKVKAAVDAGYVVVPNFPITIFAIRTTKDAPSGHDSSSREDGLTDIRQHATLGPAGDGQYVSEWPATQTERDTFTRDGKEVVEFNRYALEFKDVRFPVSLVKPQVLEATGEAMKKLIFDEIGLVSDNPRGDPIVIGRIRERGVRFGGKEVSFFIAWWLDLASL